MSFRRKLASDQQGVSPWSGPGEQWTGDEDSNLVSQPDPYVPVNSAVVRVANWYPPTPSHLKFKRPYYVVDSGIKKTQPSNDPGLLYHEYDRAIYGFFIDPSTGDHDLRPEDQKIFHEWLVWAGEDKPSPGGGRWTGD